MIMRYDQQRCPHKGSAWRHLLRDLPTIEIDGCLFQPREHHFRKDHEEASWGWYVARWVCTHGTMTGPPTKLPRPVMVGRWSYRYEWATWTEYDGTEAVGFALVDHDGFFI